MIIDCEASLVVDGERARYSRAKIGVARDHNSQSVLVVITSQHRHKLKIVNNCSLRSSAISFKEPKRHLYIRNCDELALKALKSLIAKIMSGETVAKLAHISNVEKLKPKATALAIDGAQYNVNDLKNKCLTKLCCERLKLVPRLVWKLNNLTELRLTDCELTEMPRRLSALSDSLKILDVSRNSIGVVDGCFALSMNRLCRLVLSHNKLTYLPFEMKAMQCLSDLDVSDNQLSHLPFSLGTISALKTLNLSNNSFDCLPFSLISQMSTFVRLHNLDVANNPLCAPVTHFSPEPSFPSLKCLSLTAILSTDCLLYKSHKILPNLLYQEMQLNGEMCSVCLKTIATKQFKIQVLPQSLEHLTNCLATSHFYLFPLFPSVKYLCHQCMCSYGTKIKI